MMKKLFVFSDVHSYFDALMDALSDAGFDDNNEDHVLVSLGDLCDRGFQSREVLSFINSFPEDRKICIIGNHELLMEDYINRGFALSMDVLNGTVRTAISISKEDDRVSDMKNNALWNNYKKSWRYYYEADNYIFVHGWIPFKKDGEAFKDWREASRKDFEDATWVNGMKAWADGIRQENKTIFCGHWHTSWGHCHLHHDGVEFPEDEDDFAIFDPFIDEGIVALDACTAYTGKVNVYTVEVDSL